ncbi:MAG: hypothetical protein VW891_07180 [Novosphingobium sp.]
MSLTFKGTAHPPASRSGRKTAADLSNADISLTQLGKGAGTDLLVEHDHGMNVGKVLASWPGRDGSLQVHGIVTDPDAAKSVKTGSMRGLSLGTSVFSDDAGTRSIKQDELSLCTEPRRAGCWINEVDGKRVRQLVTASAKGAPSQSVDLVYRLVVLSSCLVVCCSLKHKPSNSRREQRAQPGKHG